MAEIKKCFTAAGMPEVKFTFIIVSKRINTKFFKGQENPQSGKNSYYPLLLLLSDHRQERWWTVWSLCQRGTTTSW